MTARKSVDKNTNGPETAFALKLIEVHTYLGISKSFSVATNRLHANLVQFLAKMFFAKVKINTENFYWNP